MINPLIYPTDAAFVEQLSPLARERLDHLGFSELQTLMFDVPYCAIFGVGAGIIRDYVHRCYYKFFCVTRGVVDGLADDTLRIVVEHEAHEIQDAVRQASETHHSSGFTTLEAEVRRHAPEFADIAREHGQEVADRAISETSRLASTFPVVPRYVILYWLTVHVVAEHSRYLTFAIPMPTTMFTAEQRGRHKELLEKVANDYGSHLPWDVHASLFSATVKSE